MTFLVAGDMELPPVGTPVVGLFDSTIAICNGRGGCVRLDKILLSIYNDDGLSAPNEYYLLLDAYCEWLEEHYDGD